MTVTFCGHSTILNKKQVEEWLIEVVADLIKQGAKTFYLGGYGEFDLLCKSVLLKEKLEHKDIEILLVVPYINHNMYTQGYDATIYPDIEGTPPRYAILKRNQWMVEKSSVVVAYVTSELGGAYKALKYAKSKKKTIINLYKRYNN